jgi:hypothetical protein
VYGTHVYLAAGPAGVIDVNVALPASPRNLGNIAAVLAPGQPVNAADVAMSRLPGQTWIMVADATGDLWGLKLDGKQSVREKCFPDPRSKDCLLDLDFSDPTNNSRDPSFDPTTGNFDSTAADPSAPTFVRMNNAIVSTGRRLARPALWEQLGTLTGRRLRDSFMPGAGVLSLPVMQKMRSVQVCENPALPGFAQSGIGALGYANDAFTASGACAPFAGNARARLLAVKSTVFSQRGSCAGSMQSMTNLLLLPSSLKGPSSLTNSPVCQSSP